MSRITIRLQNYDYTLGGAYFITICTWQREMLFGEISKGEMQLNALGEIVQKEWLRTADLRPYTTLDEFIVMPNHMHSILFIEENQPNVGADRRPPAKTTQKRAHSSAPLQHRPANIGNKRTFLQIQFPNI